jgi:hypothetical protein
MFAMLGELSCGMFDTFSMAVDRLGFAWIQFSGGDLRKVSVGDLTQCDDPGYTQGQMGVNNFGMAFVSNSISDPCDRIYGNTWNGIPPFSEGVNVGDFITIDPDSLLLSKLGKTNFNGAEVTGTGDGRAYVFGGTNPRSWSSSTRPTRRRSRCSRWAASRSTTGRSRSRSSAATSTSSPTATTTRSPARSPTSTTTTAT